MTEMPSLIKNPAEIFKLKAPHGVYINLIAKREETLSGK